MQENDRIVDKRGLKMILGFDIDDVIFKTSEEIKKALDKCKDSTPQVYLYKT